MSFCGRRQKEEVNRVPDSERQVQTLPPKSIVNMLSILWFPDSTASWQDQQTLPPKFLLPKWIVYILSMLWCVLSVTVDPLFFYVPVINEERKCVALDRRLYIGSTCLRTFLDSILLVIIIWQCLRHFANARDLRGQVSQGGIPESGQNVSEWAPEMTGIPEITGTENSPKLLLWSLAINHVLAILPIPQVLLPIIFSKLRGSESLNERKVLTAVVLFQYLPRAIIVYLSSVLWRNAFTSVLDRLPKIVIAVKAGFNLFMFIVASHILGAFWYFLSVEREIACWHLACENHIECDRSSFDCNHGSFGNYTFLNNYCPIQSPNTTVFDFGIFQGALQSGTVASMDFPRKILYCFWWGLRNLSSFGSNLQTSSHFWENCFSVLTSISGLILFMYFLGRLQMYMHLAASRKLDEAHQRQKEDKRRQKKAKQLEKLMKGWEYKMKARKLRKIREWIDRQPLLKEIRETIINQVDRMFAEEENLIMSVAEENLFGAKYIISRRKYEGIVDAENPFPYLPIFTRRDIQRRLCLPLLRKVPMFRGVSDMQLQLICQYIKQVYYSQDTYIIREGEPLDRMLFITKGVLWKFATTNNNGVGSTVSSSRGECIEEGCYCGEEILNWGFHGFSQQILPNLSDLPISDKTLKTHTKVEAFALMANDLKALVSRCAGPAPTEAELMIHEAWRQRNRVRNWQSRASVMKPVVNSYDVTMK